MRSWINEKHSTFKSEPCIIIKHDMKHFSEQGFIHDLDHSNWESIDAIPDFEHAWNIIHGIFSKLVSEHAPCMVRSRDNTWFSTELSKMLHESNLAWWKTDLTLTGPASGNLEILLAIKNIKTQYFCPKLQKP